MQRQRNNKCINCGISIPDNIDKETAQDFVEYTCPFCGDIIVRGIVVTGGNRPSVPPYVRPTVPGSRLGRELLLPDDGSWSRAELWWTDISYVGLIHGRRIIGSHHLSDFVSELEEVYNESN